MTLENKKIIKRQNSDIKTSNIKLTYKILFKTKQARLMLLKVLLLQFLSTSLILLLQILNFYLKISSILNHNPLIFTVSNYNLIFPYMSYADTGEFYFRILTSTIIAIIFQQIISSIFLSFKEKLSEHSIIKQEKKEKKNNAVKFILISAFLLIISDTCRELLAQFERNISQIMLLEFTISAFFIVNAIRFIIGGVKRLLKFLDTDLFAKNESNLDEISKTKAKNSAQNFYNLLNEIICLKKTGLLTDKSKEKIESCFLILHRSKKFYAFLYSMGLLTFIFSAISTIIVYLLNNYCVFLMKFKIQVEIYNVNFVIISNFGNILIGAIIAKLFVDFVSRFLEFNDKPANSMYELIFKGEFLNICAFNTEKKSKLNIVNIIDCSICSIASSVIISMIINVNISLIKNFDQLQLNQRIICSLSTCLFTSLFIFLIKLISFHNDIQKEKEFFSSINLDSFEKNIDTELEHQA
jgi:hypothetical protein